MNIIETIHDYLVDRWRDPDNFSDFNLAIDKGFTEYAAWLINSAGAIDSEHCFPEAKEIEQEIEKLLENYTETEDRNELLKLVEVWVNPKTNEHAFLPVNDPDLDYFIDQADLLDLNFKFDIGWDLDGIEYNTSRLKI